MVALCSLIALSLDSVPLASEARADTGEDCSIERTTFDRRQSGYVRGLNDLQFNCVLLCFLCSSACCSLWLRMFAFSSAAALLDKFALPFLFVFCGAFSGGCLAHS